MLEIIIDYQFPYEKVRKSYRIIELVQPLSEFIFSRRNILFVYFIISNKQVYAPYYSYQMIKSPFKRAGRTTVNVSRIKEVRRQVNFSRVKRSLLSAVRCSAVEAKVNLSGGARPLHHFAYCCTKLAGCLSLNITLPSQFSGQQGLFLLRARSS